MRFDADTRSQVIADMALDFDPTGTSIEIQVDDDWHGAEWQDDPIEVDAGKKWTQSARTDDYFAGPSVGDPGAATVLDAGRHLTQTRVTSGATILVEPSSPVDVR